MLIDYEKAVDSIQRQIMSDINSRNVSGTLLNTIAKTYKQNTILIKFNSKLTKQAEINKGVRQVFPLSPKLFNIYFDEIITKWQKEDKRFHFQKSTNV